MTTFDNREKGYESKFAHDEELSFKAGARRNKLVGLWAAALLGKSGEAAEQYAKDLVEADFEAAGSDDVVDKLIKDFARADLSITVKEINAEMEKQLVVARKQIMGDVK